MLAVGDGRAAVDLFSAVILTGTCDGEQVNFTATGAGQFPQGFILKPYRLLEVMRTLQVALYERNSKFPMELKSHLRRAQDQPQRPSQNRVARIAPKRALLNGASARKRSKRFSSSSNGLCNPLI